MIKMTKHFSGAPTDDVNNARREASYKFADMVEAELRQVRPNLGKIEAERVKLITTQRIADEKTRT